MNNKCARCEKVVYPIEELKCLDKIWHKRCFKCQECGMALSMKSYKGFDKLPYCNAHIPQVKPTTIADTLEARRLATNTRIQSQVKYHENFEKLKGKVTQVADDAETQRLKQNSKLISNVNYHGEYDKKQQQEQKRGSLNDRNNLNNPTQPIKKNIIIQNHQVNNNQMKFQLNNNSNYSNENSQNNIKTQFNKNEMDMINQFDNLNCTDNRDEGLGYNESKSFKWKNNLEDYNKLHQKQQQKYQQVISTQLNQQQQKLKDYNEYINDQNINITNQYIQQTNQYNLQIQQPQYQHIYQQQPTAWLQPDHHQTHRMFKAMYDYTAQDTDEVSFLDGDLIVNCVFIDEGWMTGTVQRTGLSGMLPANYVEPI